MKLQLIGLVLRLLLETARTRRKLVLLTSAGGTSGRGELGHRRHTRDLLVEVVQLCTEVKQLLRTWCDIISVATSCFA